MFGKQGVGYTNTVTTPVPPRFTIRKSEWGWTAWLNGRMVAHSADKNLLADYLKECVR